MGLWRMITEVMPYPAEANVCHIPPLHDSEGARPYTAPSGVARIQLNSLAAGNEPLAWLLNIRVLAINLFLYPL